MDFIRSVPVSSICFQCVEADRARALPEETGAAKKNPTTLV